MELVVVRSDFREELSGKAYKVNQRSVGSDLLYPNLRLIPRDMPASYVGATHEYLDVGSAPTEFFDAIWFRDHAAGANRSEKFERDVRLLMRGLRADPDNARYVFYLANTYHDARQTAKAMYWYEQRIAMGGWPEEIFYSSYRIGRCLHELGRYDEMVSQDLSTFDRFPHRAEPLHALALYYQHRSQHRLALLMAETGLSIPLPLEALFVETEVYTWRLLDIAAVSKYWLGDYEESAAMNRQLLGLVPENNRDRIQSNLRFCEDHL